MKNLKAIVEFCGRKGLAFILTLAALCTVGLADPAAAEAIVWAIVGAFGVFCGANSAVTIGTTPKKRAPGGKDPLDVYRGAPIEQEPPG